MVPVHKGYTPPLWTMGEGYLCPAPCTIPLTSAPPWSRVGCQPVPMREVVSYFLVCRRRSADARHGGQAGACAHQHRGVVLFTKPLRRPMKKPASS